MPVNRKKWAEVAVASPDTVGVDIGGLRISWRLAFFSRARSAAVPSQKGGVPPHCRESHRVQGT